MSTGPADGLAARVRNRMVSVGGRPTAGEIARAVHAVGGLPGGDQVLEVVRTLHAEMAGFGPLEPLLADEEVTDVLVNGPAQVWVDRGTGLQRAPVVFPDEASLRRLCQRLVAGAGRRLDDAQPWADARLARGVRLHAVLPPLAPGGTCLSLRVAPRRAFTLDALRAAGTLTDACAALLERLVAARVAFLVSGGTGSGKTTLLSTLLSLVGPGERLLLIEDSGELLPVHPHVVRLEARVTNVEGSGAVDLATLVRQALRMRPDRLVVGEVRGAEVVDLLAALNSGHEGGCGTVHANRAADVPARLEALATAAGLDRAALHSQLAAALRCVVHLVRDRAGRRRLTEVAVLRRRGDGLVVAVPAYTARAGRWSPGPAADELDELLAGGEEGPR